MFARVGEIVGDFGRDIFVDVFRDHHSARRRETLQPRRHVHPITVDRAVVADDDIAEIDADAEMHPPMIVEAGVALAQRALNLDRRLDRLDDTVECRQHAVAGGIDDPPIMAFHMRGKDVAILGERGHGGALVVGHQPAVAGDVGGENCRQASASLVSGHATPTNSSGKATPKRESCKALPHRARAPPKP